MIRRRLARMRDLPRGQEGAVAILVALIVPVLIGLTAIAVDVARWYAEGARAQKVADAAALAGVTYMPQDFGNAQVRALDAAADNGVTSGVTVANGSRPSQLKVTVTITVRNIFGSFLGVGTTNIVREGVADYNGPAPMGSPCNTFGNEPPGGSALSGPVGSVLPAGVPNCTSNPQFWGTVQGPATQKIQGDRYSTRTCGTRGSAPTTVDGCTGQTNRDFDGTDADGRRGYYYIVRVNPTYSGGDITVQVYDPAWVYTGPQCNDSSFNVSGIGNSPNPYVTDATVRYSNTPTGRQYCPGDYDPGGSGTPPRVDTSYAVLVPNAQSDPTKSAPVATSCVKQFRGYSTAPSRNQLTASSGAYLPELAQVFHQWVPICTITNPQAGDYYIQIRTNVAMPGSSGIGTGNMAVVTQTGDDTAVVGRGNNGFGLRAVTSDANDVSVAGWDRMAIFANADSASSEFNLVRVLPGAAGKTMEFTFFDPGDASSNGTMTVLRPADATGTITSGSGIAGCKGVGVVTGNLTNCSVGITNTANNGRLQTIRVPIPGDYNCTYTLPTGCWFKVRVGFSSGTVNDITTWDANILGDPVRLVK